MDIAQALWQLLINPNVAYLLLIIGIWAGIAAFVIPGTGLAEATSILCLMLGIVGLAQLPISLVGAALMALSFVLFALELKITSHGALTIGGVVAFAFGSILLVQPTETQPGISPWIIGITTLTTLAFFGVAVRMVLRALKLPAVTNVKKLVGARGVVKQALNPVGSVQVKSELWTAISDEPLAAGDPVVVRSIEGLKLHVERAK